MVNECGIEYFAIIQSARIKIDPRRFLVMIDDEKKEQVCIIVKQGIRSRRANWKRIMNTSDMYYQRRHRLMN